jgi:hypothetical protein
VSPEAICQESRGSPSPSSLAAVSSSTTLSSYDSPPSPHIPEDGVRQKSRRGGVGDLALPWLAMTPTTSLAHSTPHATPLQALDSPPRGGTDSRGFAVSARGGEVERMRSETERDGAKTGALRGPPLAPISAPSRPRYHARRGIRVGPPACPQRWELASSTTTAAAATTAVIRHQVTFPLQRHAETAPRSRSVPRMICSSAEAVLRTAPGRHH